MQAPRVGRPSAGAFWLLLILVVGMASLALIAGPVALALPVAIAAVTGLVKAIDLPGSEPDQAGRKDRNIKRL